MAHKHALVYHGPFDLNFPRQVAGRSHYVKRDRQTVDYRVPRQASGLRFGQMEKNGKVFVITRIQAPDADVCLTTPIEGKGTGPQGGYVAPEEAARFLDQAGQSNPSLVAELDRLRLLL